MARPAAHYRCSDGVSAGSIHVGREGECSCRSGSRVDVGIGDGADALGISGATRRGVDCGLEVQKGLSVARSDQNLIGVSSEGGHELVGRATDLHLVVAITLIGAAWPGFISTGTVRCRS